MCYVGPIKAYQHAYPILRHKVTKILPFGQIPKQAHSIVVQVTQLFLLLILFNLFCVANI
jgi:hypothetical protein